MAERPAASDKPILQKLLYKPGMRAMVLNAPQSYQQALQEIPGVAQQLGDGPFEFIHVFATERAEVTQDGRKWRAALKPGGVIWVSYPKGRAVPTDLNRDSLRTVLLTVGLDPIAQVAIDDVWSALRAKLI